VTTLALTIPTVTTASIRLTPASPRRRKRRAVVVT
jgi:hypothetical protein